VLTIDSAIASEVKNRDRNFVYTLDLIGPSGACDRVGRRLRCSQWCLRFFQGSSVGWRSRRWGLL